MHGFYIYYRVDPSRYEEALAAVMRLFEYVRSHTGIAGRLLRAASDDSTWMEIFEPVENPTTFSKLLDEAVSSSGILVTLCDGKRHVEQFVPA